MIASRLLGSTGRPGRLFFGFDSLIGAVLHFFIYLSKRLVNKPLTTATSRPDSDMNPQQNVNTHTHHNSFKPFAFVSGPLSEANAPTDALGFCHPFGAAQVTVFGSPLVCVASGD